MGGSAAIGNLASHEAINIDTIGSRNLSDRGFTVPDFRRPIVENMFPSISRLFICLREYKVYSQTEWGKGRICSPLDPPPNIDATRPVG